MKKLMIGFIALALGAGVALAQGASSGSESGPTTGPSEGGPTTGPMGRQRGENDRTATMEEGQANPRDLRTVTLTVRHVDPAKHKATVDVTVSPEANITKNGEPIKIDQLKPGDQVRASFDTSTGQLVKMQVTQKGMSSPQQ